MKIAFVFQAFESLGIECLSASLRRAGHETALFFDPGLFDDTFYHNGLLAGAFDSRKSLVLDLVRWEPDLVCFSALSDLYLWAVDLAKRVKEAYPAPVVFGT